MKKRGKLNRMLLFPLLILILGFTSCQNEQERYSTGDFIVTFGMVEKSRQPGDSGYEIHLDNGDKFVSMASAFPADELQTARRVLINFAPYTDKISADSSKIIYGKINCIQNIAYKEILPLSKTNSDSIGHDPVTVRDSWLTGDSILTVDFTYLTEGSLHDFNLARTNEGNGNDKPYVLELRHNAGLDRPIYRISGYVSFNLNPLKSAGSKKVSFNLRYTDYKGNRKEIPYSIQ